MIQSLAESLTEYAYDRTPRNPAAFAAYWIGGFLHRFEFWRSLPWACRLIGHVPVDIESWNEDCLCVEERWIECETCGTFLRHHPDDPQGRGR